MAKSKLVQILSKVPRRRAKFFLDYFDPGTQRQLIDVGKAMISGEIQTSQAEIIKALAGEGVKVTRYNLRLLISKIETGDLK